MRRKFFLHYPMYERFYLLVTDSWKTYADWMKSAFDQNEGSPQKLEALLACITTSISEHVTKECGSMKTEGYVPYIESLICSILQLLPKLTTEQGSAFFSALGVLLNTKLSLESYTYTTLLSVTEVMYKALERPFQKRETSIEVSELDMRMFKDIARSKEASLQTSVATTAIKLLKAWQKYKGMNTHSQHTIVLSSFLNIDEDSNSCEVLEGEENSGQVCLFENAAVCMIDSKEMYDNMNIERGRSKKTTLSNSESLNNFLSFCVALSISDLKQIEADQGDQLFESEVNTH